MHHSIPDAFENAAPFHAAELRSLCLEAGAGDCGFVEMDRPALDAERAEILSAFAHTRTVVSLVFPMNPENIRSPVRNLSSAEVHDASEEIAAVSRRLLRQLNARGVRGAVVPADFPMDMGRFPGKIWNVSHKIMAEQAGMGRMGVNRLVIHPRFGNFVRLTSLLIDAELDAYGAPLAESPCIDCGLCEAVCPVGAVSRSRPFDLMACMTHAYRDNALGFLDMIDALLASGDLTAFRERFKDRETASMWQSLMYKMNYRCGYCMAVCPAGRAGALAFEGRRGQYMAEVFRPLRDRVEDVYVTPGSPAETRAAKNPHKEVRRVTPLAQRQG